MRVRLAAVAVLVACTAAAAAPAKTITNEAIGCAKREVHDQLSKIAASGDHEAFGKLAAAGITSGACRMFNVGDDVFVEDIALLSGVACVRPKGDVACYWLVLEAIKAPPSQ